MTSPDERINHDGLCVLTPVVAGHEAQLSRHLRDLPRRGQSPMIRAPGTHYARWAVVQLEGPDGKPLPPEVEPAHLLFASEFDGLLEPYLRRMCVRLAEDAHEIWRHCEGYPGRDPDALADYLIDHRVKPGYSVVAYPEASLERVRRAFALRERLNDFLVRTATLDSPGLQHAWEQRFRGGER